MSAVLIVDDSQEVRNDLADALEAAGFRTIACATIAEARAALRTHQIELAILDVSLPDGDGVELLSRIRRDPTLGALPVLMLSHAADIKDRVRALQAGANDFVAKPYDTEQVVARLQQLVSGPVERELVLVVHDDAAYRAELAHALGDAGFATATAARGLEGLRLAAITRPTAIVVAATMDDVDGPSVIRRLRLDPGLRATPCLLVTASEGKSEGREAEVRALDAGADGCVRHDDLELVLARLRALLRSSNGIRGETASILAPKRILAVDDDPDYLLVLGDLLRTRGFDVVRAASGEEALQLLDYQRVDCILLDRSMAGIGGVETCRRLKRAPSVRETPLIMLTATETRDAVLEGLAAGADDYVAKSSGFEVLCARVQAQIRRRENEEEQRRLHDKLLRFELAASEARAAQESAEMRAAVAEELARANAELACANRELESFCYAVSHDLRAPLRTINAFTQALFQQLGEQLDGKAVDYVRRVLSASSRMAELIDALLELARISRAPLGRHRVDLSALAHAALAELHEREPRPAVCATIAPRLVVEADGRLMRVLFDNLLGNAWRFTTHTPAPRIEVGVTGDGGEAVYFVRDNGAGFDMTDADRLFVPFARVHPAMELDGTGLGLATARRIVERHGGRIWAEGQVGAGATIRFTLPAEA